MIARNGTGCGMTEIILMERYGIWKWDFLVPTSRMPDSFKQRQDVISGSQHPYLYVNSTWFKRYCNTRVK